jgi:hypothetical protein
MRIALGLLLALFIPICAQAQEDEQWPPLSYLRKDYNDSVVVAHVRVSKAEIVARIGGYENWKIICTVIEPFKGKLKKGAEFTYYHGAESGFKTELFLGEKIVFLLHDYDETSRARRYSVIENSTLKYEPERVRKLRLIARSQRRQPSRRKQDNHATVLSVSMLKHRPNWVPITTV